MLSSLQLEVRLLTNKSRDEFQKLLKEESLKDHSDEDCLMFGSCHMELNFKIVNLASMAKRLILKKGPSRFSQTKTALRSRTSQSCFLLTLAGVKVLWK